MFILTHEPEQEKKRSYKGWLLLAILILLITIFVNILNSDLPAEKANSARTDAVKSLSEEDYQKAISSINAAIELEPDNVESLCIRSVILAELNRLDEALTDINKANQLAPDTAECLYARSSILRAKKRNNEALTDINKAIQLEPESSDYLFCRSSILYSMKRNNEALTDINKAIQLEPGYAYYLYCRSVILHDMKRFEEALKDANEAILLEPKNAEFLDGRCITLKKLKRYKEALEDIQAACELEPDSVEKAGQVGMIQYHLYQYDLAYHILDGALKKDDSISFIYRYRGLCAMALIKAGKSSISKDSALEDLSKAIEIDHENPYGYLARAEYYIWQHAYDLALTDINAAYYIDKLEPEVYHLFAVYYKTLGDTAHAAQYSKLEEEYGYIPEP